MKLSRILLYSSAAIIGVISVLSWHRSNATAAAQRRAAVVAAVQPAAVMPTTPSAIAASPIPPQFPAPAFTTSGSAAPSPGVVVPQEEPSRPAAAPSFVPAQNVQVIRTCNGRAANANLRSTPSLSPAAIVGVVPQGQAVGLTGRTAIGDGEFWYEAISLAPLYPNSDPAATNQTGVGQRGQKSWIAACFVSSGN